MTEISEYFRATRQYGGINLLAHHHPRELEFQIRLNSTIIFPHRERENRVNRVIYKTNMKALANIRERDEVVSGCMTDAKAFSLKCP